MNYFFCTKCCGIIQRDSEKKKIKSYCDETCQRSFIVKIGNADDLAVKLRKRYLKNSIDLKSFSLKERIFLKIAFEQGAKVAFNRLK
jgi:hypothetical protein